jgi:SAM-dependent methyltransferase
MSQPVRGAAGRRSPSLRTPSGTPQRAVARRSSDAGADDRAVLRRYRAFLPLDARVLDLGCGPGRHTEQLDRLGVRALGVDISPTAVAATRRRGSQAVRADVLGPLPGGADGWDGVVLLDGSSHRQGAVLDDGVDSSPPFMSPRSGRTPDLDVASCCADLHVVDHWRAGSSTFAVLRAGHR